MKKEYARIINVTGAYTKRSVENGICKKDEVYELVSLNARSATLKNGVEFPVYSGDINCLSQDEIDVLGLDVVESTVETYEEGQESSSEPLEGCTGVEKVKRQIKTIQ